MTHPTDEELGVVDDDEDLGVLDDQPPAPSAPRIGVADSAARGIGQGASLGFSDEAGGFGAWLASKVHGETPRAAGRGAQAPLSDASSYDAGRDAERAANAEASEAHPAAYGVGEVAGGILPAVAMGGASAPAGFAKFLQAGGRLGRAALTGAAQGGAYGAAAGAGHSEAQDASGVLRDTARGATTGAIAGGVLPVAAAGASRAAQSVAGGARNLANRARVGATGAYGRDVKRLAQDKGQGAIQRFGETIEREGIHGKGALPKSWGTYAENARAVVDDAGQQIGQLSQQAAQKVSIDVKPLVDDMLEQAVKLEGVRTPEARALVDDLVTRAEMLDRGPMGYDEALELRRFLDDIAWKEEGARNTAAAERARETAGKVRKAMMSAVEKESPALKKAITEQNERFEVASWAKHMSEKRLAQESGNQVVSLPAMIAGAGGLAINPPTAIASAAAAQLMKTRGHSALAGTARAVQRGAETMSGAATAPAAQQAGQALARSTAQAATPRPTVPSMQPAHASSADRAVQDEKYGSMLSQKQPEERAVAYSVLIATDPEFRARQRERSKQLQEQEERENAR